MQSAQVAVAVSLRYPFCSPQTNTPNCTFQVLRKNYHPVIGTSSRDLVNVTPFENWLYTNPSHYQTFATEAQVGRIPSFNPDGSKNTYETEWQNWWSKKGQPWTGSPYPQKSTQEMYKIPYDSNYGFPTYKPIKEYMLSRRAWSFKYETDNPVSNKIWPQSTTTDRKSTRLNSSHEIPSRMPSSA